MRSGFSCRYCSWSPQLLLVHQVLGCRCAGYLSAALCNANDPSSRAQCKPSPVTLPIGRAAPVGPRFLWGQTALRGLQAFHVALRDPQNPTKQILKDRALKNTCIKTALCPEPRYKHADSPVCSETWFPPLFPPPWEESSQTPRELLPGQTARASGRARSSDASGWSSRSSSSSGIEGSRGKSSEPDGFPPPLGGKSP